MKTTIGTKRYDSEKCEVLCERSTYNNGNYSGSNMLLRASDGMLLVMATSNGQDCYRSSGIFPFENSGFDLNDFDITDEQEVLMEKYGLLEIVGKAEAGHSSLKDLHAVLWVTLQEHEGDSNYDKASALAVALESNFELEILERNNIARYKAEMGALATTEGPKDEGVIILSGGIVRGLHRNGILQPIEVRDYDIDGVDDEELQYDEDGDAYYEYTGFSGR